MKSQRHSWEGRPAYAVRVLRQFVRGVFRSRNRAVYASTFAVAPPCAAEVDLAIFGPGTLNEIVARKAECHRRIEADRAAHGTYAA